MAAQAAAVPHPGMIEPRGTSLSMPVLYDLRFVGSPNAPMLVNVTPEAIERLLPARASAANDPATASAPPAAPVVAATAPAVPVETMSQQQTPPAIEAPLQPAKPITEAVAAVAPQPPVESAPPIAQPPAIEAPLAVEPPQDIVATEPQAVLQLTPITEPSAPVEADSDTPLKTAALAPIPEPTATPAAAAAKAHPAKVSRRAAIKVARKKHARAARRAAAKGQFGSQFGNQPPANSFGAQ
jgi:hypothetical protein